MKKLFILLLTLTSLSTFADTIKASANGYGENDQVACEKAKKHALTALQEKCTKQDLNDVEFSACRFVSEGDYYVVYTVDAKGKCVLKPNL